MKCGLRATSADRNLEEAKGVLERSDTAAAAGSLLEEAAGYSLPIFRSISS